MSTSAPHPKGRMVFPFWEDTTPYPPTIDRTDPDHAWRRKSFRVWGCDFGDGPVISENGGKTQRISHEGNPYYPYGYPVMSPGTMLFIGKNSYGSYRPHGVAQGYLILTGDNVRVRCVLCGGTLWFRGEGEREKLWDCADPDCAEDHGAR